eukprot:11098632-Heterocapsa_arctica.AAC.2
MSTIATNQRTPGAILERHLRNAMTAVVSQAVSELLAKGVRHPVDGQWELNTIKGLMTTIGGHGMDRELSRPAYALSRCLARNLTKGDT